MTKTENNENEIVVRNFLYYFKELWKDSKPLAKLFRTDSASYLYDTGTNKLLSCSDAEYDFINSFISADIDQAFNKVICKYKKEEILPAFQNIKKAIEKENILLIQKPTRFGLSYHYQNIESLINTRLGMIQLDTTERCNFRCDYCIYNSQVLDKRNHGNRNMSLPIAYAAIDYLAEHSKKRQDICVSFYGGEPLLRFPFIKSCVDYANSRITGREIRFALTTNVSLMTSEMADYFYKNNFGITASLDGPEDVNDEYRKDIKGQPTFKRIMIGLKKLIDVFGQNSHRVSLSMVYAPPYNEQRIKRVSELWDEIPWIPKDIGILITYPHPGSVALDRLPKGNFIDVGLFDWARNEYLDSYIRKEKSHVLARSMVEKKLATIFQRSIYKKPTDKYHLNGCCLPAVRKIFVSVDGELHLCERLPIAPSIGHVNSGVSIERVKDIYINEYGKKSLPFCASCWAIQLCHICYLHSFSNGMIDLNKKSKNCIMARLSIEEDLQFFSKLLEIDNKGLDYLSKWVIV
jgi:uncharacterized protein